MSLTIVQLRSVSKEIQKVSIIREGNQSRIVCLFVFHQLERSFDEFISNSRGHMEAALLHIYKGADPKREQPSIYRDAKLIHDAMKGFGTRDHELIWR